MNSLLKSSNSYCPKCLSASLEINEHGIVHVIVNNKQRDTGRFLYNIVKQSKDQIKEEAKKTIDDFFGWYSKFDNKDPISSVELSSSDFKCVEGCPIDIRIRFSVVDVLLSSNEIMEIIEDLAKKYSLSISANED